MFFVSFTIVACKKDIRPVNETGETSKIQLTTEKKVIADQVKNRLELITLISMDIFESNSQLKNAALEAIKKNRKSGKDERISFNDILQSNTPITTDFSKIFLREFASRLESGNFPYVKRVQNELEKVRVNGRLDTRSLGTFGDFGDWNFDYITMSHIGSYIHFPYSEFFENASNPQLHYTFDPLNPQATQAEVFQKDGQTYNSDWVSGDEKYAMENATWIFLLDDVIAGNHYDNYMQSPCAKGDFLNQLCANEILPPYQTQPLSPPPPPPNTTYNGPLENNIPPFAHATITDDKYLLSASIPHVRIKRNVRPGFWNGSNRITLYRGNARIAVPNRNNFSEAILDTSFAVINQKEISRKNGNKANWVDESSVYTYQWKQEQVDNYLVVTYIAHWLYFDGGDIDFKANIGVEWNNTLQIWVPKFDANASVKGKISINRRREIVMGEIYIPRASFMANAIGNNFGLGTCNNTGASYCSRDWAVRSIGSNFEFYWSVNITY